MLTLKTVPNTEKVVGPDPVIFLACLASFLGQSQKSEFGIRKSKLINFSILKQESHLTYV